MDAMKSLIWLEEWNLWGT